ncbi:LemA family protein [Oryzomonas rubra]|uniref:LemA family protein n=1 Tax=Oryzomonas rubra TaxID=2509454 RepID=A0A5A9XPQ1_9BACT|nr:LemA family protein [Oryzomonas rubra]KAA0894228.1 LemA family protein [Oryzomonas rubra]
MANELDELTGQVNGEGRDVNVIYKQIRVEVGTDSKIFEVALWTVGPIIGLFLLLTSFLPRSEAIIFIVLGILPGVIFIFMKVNALAYLRKLEQRIQADASQIDNYLEQRVMILQNVVGLIEKSIDLDKDVMKTVAAYRGGQSPASDLQRNETSGQLDGVFSRINVAFESYPDLKAQAVLADAMRQNSYLQKEITAARTLYNDTLSIWNQDIFAWPTKQIVAAKAGYTTRIPFTASTETKVTARGKFF